MLSNGLKNGLSIFPTDLSIRPDELAREAEARGFESLFVCEHSHWPLATEAETGRARNDDFARSLDPFTALAAAAAVTNQLRLGTAICLAAQRDPIHLAKETATLDYLSGGRFVLGVGGGWNTAEARNHGVDPVQRWRVMVDHVKAVRALWADDIAEYHGPYVDLDCLELHPDPVQKPGPPVLMGGNGPRVLARVVDCADGWLPFGQPVEQLTPRVRELRSMAQAAGRPEPTVTIFAAPMDRHALDGYAELGIDRVLFHLPAGDRDATVKALDEIVATVD